MKLSEAFSPVGDSGISSLPSKMHGSCKMPWFLPCIDSKRKAFCDGRSWKLRLGEIAPVLDSGEFSRGEKVL